MKRAIIVGSLVVALVGATAAVLVRQDRASAQPQISCTQDSDCPAYAPRCVSSRCAAPLPPAGRPSARATFGVTGAPIGACLVSVDPSRARVGAPVDLEGRRFGASGQVEFTDLSGGYTPATSTGPWSGTAVNDAGVPVGAVNGTVRVNPASSGPSNELSFRVLGSSGGGGGPDDDPEACISNAVCGVDNDCPSPFVNGCAMNRNPRCCQARPRVVEASPRFGVTDVCLNGAVLLSFSAPIDSVRGRSQDVVLFQRSTDGGASWSNVEANRSVAGDSLIISPRSCAMAAGSMYRVVLRGGTEGAGMRTRQGVSMYCDSTWAPGSNGSIGGCSGLDYVLGFTADAGGSQCTVASATTVPARQSVGISEAATFDAVGRAANGRAVCTTQVNWSLPAPVLPGVSGAPGPRTSFIATAGTTVGSTQVQGSVATPSGPVSSQSTLEVTAGSPRVVGSSSCTAGQSPAPQPDRADACVNSVLQVRFNMPMDPASIAGGLDVMRCSSGGSFDFASCGVAVGGSSDVFADRLTFTPAADLQPDTWYWVGVPVGARSRTDLGGRPLADLNFDSDPASNPGNDMYAWKFKTRTSADRCQIQAVEVDPGSHAFTRAADTWDFVSHAVSRNQCSIIAAPNSWTWNVLNPGVAALDSSSGNRATVRAVDNGSTQLQARLGGFSTPGSSDITVTLPNPLRLGAVTGGQCRNSVITAEFTRPLDASTVPGNILVEEFSGGVWTTVGATVRVSAAGYGRTVVTLTPPGMLSESSPYRLWVRGGGAGIRDQLGQQLQDDDGSYPAFKTVALGTPPREVCAVSRVEVTRNTVPVRTDTFLCGGTNNCGGDDDPATAGNQHAFRAQARAASGDIVSASYRWTVPRGGNLVTVTPNPAVAQDVTLTAGNQNGSATVVVDATNDYGSARGSVGVRLFLCSNPWPSPTAAGDWGPFLDNDTGFSFFYCRDDGSPATTTDDLPPLPTPTRRNMAGDLFREIIFLPGAAGGEVNPANGVPYIDYLPSITVDENEEVRFYVNAHDPENDTLSFAPDGGFSNLTWSPISPMGPQVLNLGSSALFTWRPGPTQGGSTPGGFVDYTATFHVRDSAGDAGHSNPVLIRVMDTSLPEPPPPPPASVLVNFASGDPVHALGNVSWNRSSFADTYRVYRRDDGAAGGGDGNEEGISYGYPSELRNPLRRVADAVRSWVAKVISPIARALNIPSSFAAAADIEPLGSYVEVATPPVDDSSCGARCAYADSGAPVSRRLCYAVKACNEAGCSGFSAPACGDAPPPNTLPTVTFVQPSTPGQNVPLGSPFTFRAQLAEADPGDHIASYQWTVDGTALPAVNGDFGSAETVEVTRTFSVAGAHTVSLRVTDGNGARPVPDASTSVNAQANDAPDACIINPTGPQPAWCT